MSSPVKEENHEQGRADPGSTGRRREHPRPRAVHHAPAGRGGEPRRSSTRRASRRPARSASCAPARSCRSSSDPRPTRSRPTSRTCADDATAHRAGPGRRHGRGDGGRPRPGLRRRDSSAPASRSTRRRRRRRRGRLAHRRHRREAAPARVRRPVRRRPRRCWSTSAWTPSSSAARGSRCTLAREPSSPRAQRRRQLGPGRARRAGAPPICPVVGLEAGADALTRLARPGDTVAAGEPLLSWA